VISVVRYCLHDKLRSNATTRNFCYSSGERKFYLSLASGEDLTDGCQVDKVLWWFLWYLEVRTFSQKIVIILAQHQFAILL